MSSDSGVTVAASAGDCAITDSANAGIVCPTADAGHALVARRTDRVLKNLFDLTETEALRRLTDEQSHRRSKVTERLSI
jgi:hypothetical protein